MDIDNEPEAIPTASAALHGPRQPFRPARRSTFRGQPTLSRRLDRFEDPNPNPSILTCRAVPCLRGLSTYKEGQKAAIR